MLATLKSVNLFKNVAKLCTATSTNLLHTSQICEKKEVKNEENKGGCAQKGGKKKRKIDCGPTKVAVILSGCGALDGTEISEAVSIAIHLTSRNIKPKFYAPDINICGTVNHLTMDPEDCGQPRNALVESARLARSSIKPLCHCTACAYSALIIPGGFGAARTLSDFASKGCNCVLLPDVARLIREFACFEKPIGSLCIASALVAKALEGVRVTLGMECPKEQWAYAEVIEKVKQMGADVELKDVKGVTHCSDYNCYSTPAWLDTHATYADVHQGIGNMIEMMSKSIK